VKLCLVTDRRRLCADTTPFDVARRCLVEQTRLAVAAGVDLIQVRELDLATGVLAALVTDMVHLAHGTDTRIVVNDRLDVALACGAAGVHLRGDSMPAEAVRQIAPAGFLMGIPFPTGLTRLEARFPQAVRWAWALNAAASVLGSATAIFLAIYIGLRATVLVGAGLYLCALLVLWLQRQSVPIATVSPAAVAS